MNIRRLNIDRYQFDPRDLLKESSSRCIPLLTSPPGLFPQKDLSAGEFAENRGQKAGYSPFSGPRVELGYTNGFYCAGESLLTLNVIVYQYGKVASTSLVDTFNRMPGVTAFQCHFFGEEAFRATVTRLCSPQINEYFFKHSLGQLVENLKAYRVYQKSGQSSDDRCIVLTVAREPFDWFRSSITQEIEGHLPALKLSLRDREVTLSSDRENVIEGLQLLMKRIHLALDTVGGDIDALVPDKRRLLDQMIPFTDTEDFEAFLFILSRFLQPHVWFRTQFSQEFGISVPDMLPVAPGLFRAAGERCPIYLARYEELQSAFSSLLELEQLKSKRLSKVNEGHSKEFAAEISEVFKSESAQRLKARSRSEITRLLGYNH